jgi:hypothetical protein
MAAKAAGLFPFRKSPDHRRYQREQPLSANQNASQCYRGSDMLFSFFPSAS